MKNKKKEVLLFFFAIRKSFNLIPKPCLDSILKLLYYFFLGDLGSCRYCAYAWRIGRSLEAVVRWRLALYAACGRAGASLLSPKGVLQENHIIYGRQCVRFHLIEARAAKPLIDVLSIARYDAHTPRVPFFLEFPASPARLIAIHCCRFSGMRKKVSIQLFSLRIRNNNSRKYTIKTFNKKIELTLIIIISKYPSCISRAFRITYKIPTIY